MAQENTANASTGFRRALKWITGGIAATCLAGGLVSNPELLAGAAIFGILWGLLFVNRAI